MTQDLTRPLQHRVIELDIPCTQCGYNLRGLDPDSKCPECGLEIVPSLVAYRDKRQRNLPPLHASGKHWLKSQIEGISLLLLAFLIAMIIAAWPRALDFGDPLRKILLLLLVEQLTLGWMGAWKLGTATPKDYRPNWRRAGTWLRITATFGTFGMTLLPQIPHNGWCGFSPLQELAGIVMIPAVIAAPVLLYLHLRRLASRAELSTVEVFLMLVMGLVVFLTLSSMAFQLDPPIDSLSTTWRVPSIVYGNIEALRPLRPWDVFFFAAALTDAIAVTLMVLLLMKLCQALRTVRINEMSLTQDAH